MYYIMIGKNSDNEIISWNSIIKDFNADFSPESVDDVAVLTIQIDGYIDGYAYVGGNVIGPDSNILNGIATWNGTSGRVIKNTKAENPILNPLIYKNGFAELPVLSSGNFRMLDIQRDVEVQNRTVEDGVFKKYTKKNGIIKSGWLANHNEPTNVVVNPNSRTTLRGISSSQGSRDSWSDIIPRPSYFVDSFPDGYAITSQVLVESQEYGHYKIKWYITMKDVTYDWEYNYKYDGLYTPAFPLRKIWTQTGPHYVEFVVDGDFDSWVFNVTIEPIVIDGAVDDYLGIRIENHEGIDMGKVVITPVVEFQPFIEVKNQLNVEPLI